mmetsp:Transcript_106487/g.343762  ORF Transcript_106487/g.343762 Transcript_106487/m.343762 type:complete len:209 (+) Transcript_106487:61-687(+)
MGTPLPPPLARDGTGRPPPTRFRALLEAQHPPPALVVAVRRGMEESHELVPSSDGNDRGPPRAVLRFARDVGLRGGPGRLVQEGGLHRAHPIQAAQPAAPAFGQAGPPREGPGRDTAEPHESVPFILPSSTDGDVRGPPREGHLPARDAGLRGGPCGLVQEGGVRRARLVHVAPPAALAPGRAGPPRVCPGEQEKQVANVHSAKMKQF